MYRAIFAISTALIPIALRFWLKYRHRIKLKKIQNKESELDKYYYHCIFWTLNNIKCRQHIFDSVECGNNCSYTYLQTLVKLLASSQVSIKMCMYHLTLRRITDELITARKRGVDVRIVTDDVTSRMEHSKMKLLKNKFGFDVRTPPYRDAYMHHKYCVIDAEDPNLKKMFLGSLNLTLQGCAANFEFVVITNNSFMVSQYSNEFDLLWSNFEKNPQAAIK